MTPAKTAIMDAWVMKFHSGTGATTYQEMVQHNKECWEKMAMEWASDLAIDAVDDEEIANELTRRKNKKN